MTILVSFELDHRRINFNATKSIRFSKSCHRTIFLDGEPVVTKEIIKFKNGKIIEVEIADYVIFSGVKWDNNKENIVNWINENHPELDGFIYDQTKKGVLKYLAAMDFYKKERFCVSQNESLR